MGNLAFIKSFDEKNYYAFQIEGKGGILFLGKKKDFHYETSYKILRSLKLASNLLFFFLKFLIKAIVMLPQSTHKYFLKDFYERE